MAMLLYNTELLERRSLSPDTFEVDFSRPSGFDFTAGQRIRLVHGALDRDYSLANAPDDEALTLCIRRVAAGRLSPLLSSMPVGSAFAFSGPHGYFVFRPSARPAVFVATGTGIAPFAAMARSGIEGFTLLHGVRQESECYYAALLRSRARHYLACLSQKGPSGTGTFRGRVTDYLAAHLEPGAYDFYLCGRGNMVRDATWIVDERFTGSMVYSEIYY
ncbi:MAG: FAD-binding oxidoreductase [Desulfobacterales bacterium]